MSSSVFPDCLRDEYNSAEIFTDFSVSGITMFSAAKSSKTANCFNAFFASKPLVIS